MVILGKYQLTISENYDQYLDIIGVSIMDREMIKAEKPTVEIKQDGDEFVITTKSASKTTEIKFKLGREFEEVTWDGSNCKSIITQETDNRLVQTQICKGKIRHIVRHFAHNKLTMTHTSEGVVSTRIFTQVK